PGKISTLVLREGIGRFDFGIEEGTDGNPFYDQMVGKNIVNGTDRNEAMAKKRKVLEKMEKEGITCNLPLLQRIMDAEAFTTGNYTTKFLDEFNKLRTDCVVDKMKVDLNCDMGESFGLYTQGNDEAMMQYITSANIACGYHAGDPHVMRET